MKLSRYFFHTLKESPNDAEIESHRLLIRAGFIKKLAPGMYSLLPLGLRSLRKFETIVREEMNLAGALEILMPMVQPKELWEETNRWEIMGKGLLKIKDRNDHDFCLGATHEEVVTDIARKEIRSYRDLPVNLYQIQTKFRDEVRPRFGLMRGKEFIMKDAYSFDVNKANALKSYDMMYEAYKRIFTRCGLVFRTVKADSGAIGGSHTHEFQVLAQSGEDQIMACVNCDYASNVEITPAIESKIKEAEQNQTDIGINVEKQITALGFVKEKSVAGIELYNKAGKKLPTLTDENILKIKGHFLISTPHLKTIEDLAKYLKWPAHGLVKTLFFKNSKNNFICVLLRGDAEVNEIKLKNFFGDSIPLEMASENEVLQITSAHPGSCGPLGLKIPIICDDGLKDLKDWTVGANIDGYHLLNINPEIDFKPTSWADIRKAKEGDGCPECQTGLLKSHRGIEVGHVFYLGDKYSKAMGASFLDENGKSNFCEMGCYGIGVSRTIQAAIEQNHDKDGMIWPLPLAPFQVLICLLDVGDSATKEAADALYHKLKSRDVEVLYDDRDERPGGKFKDADLIGIPLRINIGKRSLSESGQLEFVDRKSKKVSKVSVREAEEATLIWLKTTLEQYQ